MKWKKRAMSFVLAVCMMLTAVPAAFAENAEKKAGSSLPFTDVPEDAWYYECVQYVYSAGLMKGTSETIFAPNKTMSRAMVVQVMYNYDQTVDSPYTSQDGASFSDVKPGAWYYDAVQWASANGIAAGQGNGTFAPNKNVNREQTVQFLYNYSGRPAVSGTLPFSDADKVSGWAKDAMLWAYQNKIISGVMTSDGDLLLAPQGNATRAQAAALLMNFLKASGSVLTVSIDQPESTVTDIHQGLTGTFLTDEGVPVDTITYTVSNAEQGEENYASGQVMLDETAGTWKLDDVQLLPGKNVITVTVADSQEKTAEAQVALTYDSGTLKEYSESEVTYTNEEQTAGYVNDVVLVTLDGTMSEEERAQALEQACETADGTVVGQLNGSLVYQIQVAQSDYDALTQLNEQISSIDGVSGAYCDTIVPQETPEIEPVDESDDESEETTEETQRAAALASGEAVIPDDPWKDVFQGLTGQRWNENKPQGLNWWVESVHALSAWSHADACGKVKVGIVDGGVDTSHEDLSVETLKENVVSDHGTHVSGIIGAIANNKKGITGMVWNKKQYAYDAYEGAASTYSSTILEGVTKLVESGVKVVNDSNGGSYDESAYASTAGSAINTIENLVNNVTDDFIVVQAAGNDGVDARHNGSFCTVTDDMASQEVLDHIIVVAAANKPSSGNYKLTDFSNYGETVTVAAPGKSIFSTIQTGGMDGDYGKMSGTSMATPVVTGLAAMVWSVNPDFSAGEVKGIIKSTATKAVQAYQSEDSGTYYLVNADAAVEEAISRTTADGYAEGRFVDATTGSGLQADFRVHAGSQNGSVVYTGTSDSDGSFGFDLPAGQYVIEVNGELNGVSFITSYTSCEIKPNETTSLGDIPISTEVGENTYRVVLEWGETPYDLDSHFRADMLDGTGSIHVFYSSMQSDPANLDVDDTDSYGPETVTVADFASLDGFTYSVHNYSDRDAVTGEDEAYNLAKSGAIVKVYKANSLLRTFSVPSNKAGTVWNVFSIDRDGTIHTLNTFGFESDPDYVGSTFVENSELQIKNAKKSEKPAAEQKNAA